MLRKLVIIAALLGVLVLAGCGGTTESGNWKTFIGGTEGVSIEFDVEAPPNEVNVDEPFSVMVKLENKGEHTVPSGEYRVRLKGFSPMDFGVSNEALTVEGYGEDLQANVMDPDSGETLESYPVYITVPESGEPLSYVGSLDGNTRLPFQAEVCYKYVTTASAKLCIKEDLSKTTDTNVCVISGPQPVSSSGGPVQISDFKESSGGANAIRFSFDIIAANTGGAIAERDSWCSNDRVKQDRIYVTVDTGLDGLTCYGFMDSTNNGSSGYVKLTGGSRQVTCSQPVDAGVRGDYVKVISISAEYDYWQSVRKDVLIKQIIQ